MFPVETRYLGRAAEVRIEDQMTAAIVRRSTRRPARCWRSCRGKARSAASPNGSASASRPRDRPCPALWRPRHRPSRIAPCALAARPPQGRAGDIHCRNVADHRGRARGRRLRSRSRAALRAGRRPDAAGDRARLARRRRSASWPGRPARARRVLPAMGRARDAEPASASPSPRSATPTSRALVLDCATWGIADPPRSPGSIRRRRRAGRSARGARGLGAIDADGRLTALGRSAARLPLPPRLAMMLACSRTGSADRAAEIAAVLVERGLGGNDSDIAIRLGRIRPSRIARAGEDMRRLAGNWARIGGRRSRRQAAREADRRLPHCWARLSRSHCQIARQRWAISARQWPRCAS